MRLTTQTNWTSLLNWKNFSIFLLLLFGALMILIPVTNHYLLRTYAFDYGVYNFAFYDYAHFKVSANPIYWHNDTTFLQDHLSFTLFFLTPFYWLLKWLFGTYTLLILQSLFIIWGGWATWKLIVEKTNSELFGFLALVLYFTLYGRYSAFAGDCNLMIILSSFVPVFLLYFHRGKTWIAVACFLFLILGRESMPLWTFFLSIFLMIIYRKDRNKLILGGIFCIASIVYFVLAFKVLIPYLENPNRPFDLFTYAKLGKTPFEALTFMFSHPLDTFKLLFINHSGDAYYDNIKAEFYYVYLLSGGALLILRPHYVIPFIPIIAQKMFNDGPVRWGIASYYGIEIVSLLPILIFLALGDIKWRKVGYFLGSVACIMAISITLHKLKPENREISWAGMGKINPFTSTFYDSNLPISSVYDQLSKIPNDASVAATGNLVPHLAFRENISYFPRVLAGAEYVVILDDGARYLVNDEQFKELIDDFLDNKEFKVIHQETNFYVFKKI